MSINKKLNFWHLSSIMGASVGMPGMMFGHQFAAKFGIKTALASILSGNAILWLVAIAIVTMAFQDRTDAIENTKTYLGKTASIIAAVILVIAFLAWFGLQLSAAMVYLEKTIQGFEWSQSAILRVGILLGATISLVSVGGLKAIKWICCVSLPILFVYILFLAFQIPHTPLPNSQFTFSSSAISITVAGALAGLVNLPTFFRHASSKSDAYFALTLMTLLVSFFEAGSIWIDFDYFTNTSAHDGSSTLLYTFSLFVILSTLCVNIVNIYFASAGWKAIVPHITGPKEFIIVGLIGTGAYVFAESIKPQLFVENLADNFIACLGIILLLALLTRIVVHHRPRKLDKLVSNSCWAIGCLSALIIQISSPDNPSNALMVGIGMSVLSFIVAIFVEETIWASRNLPKTSR